MSSDAVKTLVQAFISCHLDYCNSMFYGITDGLMSRLQSVQNAAASVQNAAARTFGVGGSTLWSLTKVVVSCVLPTQGHILSEGPAAAVKTDALLLQVRGCGTVCQLV